MSMLPIRLLTAVLLVSAPAAAQSPVAPDGPPPAVQFAGCWTAADGLDTRARTCVVPEGAATLKVITVSLSGDLTESELHLTGRRVAVQAEGCDGWEEAHLSADGERIIVRAEYACADHPRQRRETAFAITPSGHWLQVTGVGIAIVSNAQVRVFEPVHQYGEIPVAVRTQVMPYLVDAERARRDIGARRISARDLTELERVGLATPLLDVLVAASYPQSLALDARGGVGASQVAAAPREPGTATGAMSPFYFMNGYPMLSMYDWNLMYSCARFGAWNCPYGALGYSPFGFGWGGGYLGGFGGYWPGMGYPVVVRPVPSGGAGAPRPTDNGRAVRGRGYTQTGGTSTGTAQPRTGGVSAPAMQGGGSSARGDVGGGGSRAGGSTGGASGGGTRTAKPRDP